MGTAVQKWGEKKEERNEWISLIRALKKNGSVVKWSFGWISVFERRKNNRLHFFVTQYVPLQQLCPDQTHRYLFAKKDIYFLLNRIFKKTYFPPFLYTQLWMHVNSKKKWLCCKSSQKCFKITFKFEKKKIAFSGLFKQAEFHHSQLPRKRKS